MFPETIIPDQTILPDRDSLQLQSVTCDSDTLVVVVQARRVRPRMSADRKVSTIGRLVRPPDHKWSG